KAGFPDGVLRVVVGSGEEVFNELLDRGGGGGVGGLCQKDNAWRSGALGRGWTCGVYRAGEA
ncbi:MAG: hypothetical protein QXK71_05605, partial [Pyrobaculum sp.]